MRKAPEVIISVRGGEVTEVKAPINAKVTLREYDVEGLTADLLERDENGDFYRETILQRGYFEINWRHWIEDLADRITSDISKTGSDPLDGDETDRIGRLLTLELDLRQGNLTEQEYRRELVGLESV